MALSAKTKPDNWKTLHGDHRQNVNRLKYDVLCYNCRKEGHYSRNCTKPKMLSKKTVDGATISMALVTDIYMYDFNTAQDWHADYYSIDHITSHF